VWLLKEIEAVISSKCAGVQPYGNSTLQPVEQFPTREAKKVTPDSLETRIGSDGMALLGQTLR